ncbi:MAG TPA: hypothetical protein VF610_00555, partial [Segetibacter sp.]
FFKNGTSTIKNGSTYTAEKVAPVYNRYYEKLQLFARKNPRRTATGMLVFASLNFVLMVYMVNRKPAAPLVPKELGKSIAEFNKKESSAAPFTISNYMKITKLKDSLDYLIKLPKLTKSDSLLFVRICDEYAKLDPTFFNQVKEAINKKKNNPNHEKDNH